MHNFIHSHYFIYYLIIALFSLGYYSNTQRYAKIYGIHAGLQILIIALLWPISIPVEIGKLVRFFIIRHM